MYYQPVKLLKFSEKLDFPVKLGLCMLFDMLELAVLAMVGFRWKHFVTTDIPFVLTDKDIQ